MSEKHARQQRQAALRRLRTTPLTDTDYRGLWDLLDGLPVRERAEGMASIRYLIARLIEGRSRTEAGPPPPHWSPETELTFELGLCDPEFRAAGLAWLLGGDV